MMKVFSLAVAAVMTVALATPMFACASPWDGSWEISPDKSKVAVHTFRYAMTPDGRIQYLDGSTFAYAFACDGKSYPTSDPYDRVYERRAVRI